MKLKPTATSFFMRYSIFTYFFLWALFSLAIKDEISFGWYLFIWILMTLLPALFHTFKRVRFGWFFWIGLLDLIAFLPKINSLYSKIEALSSNEVYRAILGWFQGFSEVKIFIIVSLIGIAISQLYRLTFSYEINENGISLKSGIFSRKDRTIISAHITDIEVDKGFFQRFWGIGNVIPITSSGMGGGANMVFGGLEAQTKAGIGGIVGSARSQNVAINDPAYIIYGVKNPERVKDEILSLIQKTVNRQ